MTLAYILQRATARRKEMLNHHDIAVTIGQFSFHYCELNFVLFEPVTPKVYRNLPCLTPDTEHILPGNTGHLVTSRCQGVRVKFSQ